MSRGKGKRDRPHRCVHEAGGIDGAPARTYHFASHDGLVFHIVREHLVRASQVERCDVDCPMLTPPEEVAASAS